MMDVSPMTNLVKVVAADLVSPLEVLPTASPDRQLSCPESLPLPAFELALFGGAMGLLLYVDFAVLQGGVCGRVSLEAEVCFAG